MGHGAERAGEIRFRALFREAAVELCSTFFLCPWTKASERESALCTAPSGKRPCFLQGTRRPGKPEVPSGGAAHVSGTAEKGEYSGERKGESMLKTMLIGEWRSGKSSLIRVLSGAEYAPRKVLAVDFFRNFVNTPSEFLENRRFYPALITASADCDVLVFVQDATRTFCQIPPGFASMFNRRVVGVITKIDLPEADLERARRFLKNAGVKDIFCVSVTQGTGMKELAAAILLK